MTNHRDSQQTGEPIKDDDERALSLALAHFKSDPSRKLPPLRDYLAQIKRLGYVIPGA
jgi:hypothetical protein